jgi:RNA polymerase sigma factor FliA
MSKDPPEVLQRVHDGLALVETIASQLKRTLDASADYDELVACGREALVDLARRFDPTLGVPFRLFAAPRLQGAMKDGIRRMVPLSRRVHENLTAPREAGDERQQRADKHVARVATAQADGVLPKAGVDTANEFLAVSPKTLADEVLQRNEGRALMERCIGMMPASEGTVIRGYYLDQIPIDRLARELGLSRRKTRILHERGLERLKKLMARAAGE